MIEVVLDIAALVVASAALITAVALSLRGRRGGAS
jgi:hypothetical protein